MNKLHKFQVSWWALVFGSGNLFFITSTGHGLRKCAATNAFYFEILYHSASVGYMQLLPNIPTTTYSQEKEKKKIRKGNAQLEMIQNERIVNDSNSDVGYLHHLRCQNIFVPKVLGGPEIG